MTSDPRKFVALWLAKKKILVDERGGLTSPDKRDYFEIFDTLILDYCEQVASYNHGSDKKIKGAPETNMRKALDEFISLEMVKRRAEIFAKVKFSGTENLAHVEKFVTALIGKPEKKVVGVLAHFLWQIKRRLVDKEVVFHIMPIIYGPQGAGKSYAIKALLSPIANLTMDLKVTDVTDSRFYVALNRNFVVVFDEMAGAKKADVEVLKTQISATYNDVRKLGTNQVTKMKQNASFVGTTNRPVNELIFDPTGARRFYEIRTLPKLDWETIEKGIDYAALFQGIDETRERGYLETVLNEVTEDQKDLIGIDEVAAFLEAYRITPGAKEIAVTKVYEAYKIWAELNGIKTPINSIWLGRKIANKGMSSITITKGGKSYRMYLIDPSCDLHKKTADPLLSPLDEKKWDA